VFAGERYVATTVEGIVEAMEKRCRRASRISATDRRMVSVENLIFLRATAQHERDSAER
jgi:C4-type Zn-finger protein